MLRRALLVALFFLPVLTHAAEPAQYKRLEDCERRCKSDRECSMTESEAYECVPLSPETCEKRCTRKGYVCHTAEGNGLTRCISREKARLEEEAYNCAASCDGSCKRVGKHYECNP